MERFGNKDLDNEYHKGETSNLKWQLEPVLQKTWAIEDVFRIVTKTLYVIYVQMCMKRFTHSEKF